MSMTLNVILEEAIKSWNHQIHDLKKTGEWFKDDSLFQKETYESIKNKEKLIEYAKKHIESKTHAMASKG